MNQGRQMARANLSMILFKRRLCLSGCGCGHCLWLAMLFHAGDPRPTISEARLKHPNPAGAAFDRV
jgi:hypothetical protein